MTGSIVVSNNIFKSSRPFLIGSLLSLSHQFVRRLYRLEISSELSVSATEDADDADDD